MDCGSSEDEEYGPQPPLVPSFLSSFATPTPTSNTLFDPFLQQQQPNTSLDFLGSNSNSISSQQQQQQQQESMSGHLVRPGKGISKKRSRASRRAPTTVLTTDTSNFRAMVQEFTGIPAPPFSGATYSRLRTGHLGPIRPLASPIMSFQSLLQQPQPHHQMVSSSMEDQIQAPQTHHHLLNNNGAKFSYIPATCDGTLDSWICPPQ